MADQLKLQFCKTKPRVFILSDISNEPDDAESLVRYLLYSNEFDTRGLVVYTSTWMRNVVHPEDMETVIKVYSRIVDNLNTYVYPENQYTGAEYFLSILKTGPSLYGKEALNDMVLLSEDAALLIQYVNESENPLQVLCQGGINVLAQALQYVQRERRISDFTRFCSKLYIYAISDQDDTGIWIRLNFPDIFYICSVYRQNEYRNVTWIAISGDILGDFDRGGPDRTKIIKEQLKEHIQIGLLGQAYPNYAFIIEGDIPIFLYLIQNSLGFPEYPEQGSWGGRYILVDLGGTVKYYSDTRDEVIGKNGQKYNSNHTTIQQQREYYQDSFSVRIQQMLTNDKSKANYIPVVIINDSSLYPELLILEEEAGVEIILDALQSYDPDGDKLNFKWFQYKEPTSVQLLIYWLVPDIEFQSIDRESRIVKVKLLLPEKYTVNIVTGKVLEKGMVLDLILQVTDNGSPKLTIYKRVVVQITNPKLLGGRERQFDTVTAALGKD